MHWRKLYPIPLELCGIVILDVAGCTHGEDMNDHPNKHIREAVDYALEHGWRLVKSGARSHAWGRLYCPAQARGACIITVYGTPRVPENHARYIRRRVDACPHGAGNGEEEEGT